MFLLSVSSITNLFYVTGHLKKYLLYSFPLLLPKMPSKMLLKVSYFCVCTHMCVCVCVCAYMLLCILLIEIIVKFNCCKNSFFIQFADFQEYYHVPACNSEPSTSFTNLSTTVTATMTTVGSTLYHNMTSTNGTESTELAECHRDVSLLYLLLLFGTLWVGVTLYNFTKT